MKQLGTPVVPDKMEVRTLLLLRSSKGSTLWVGGHGCNERLRTIELSESLYRMPMSYQIGPGDHSHEISGSSDW